MDTEPLLAEGHVRLKRCRFGPTLYLASDRYIGRSLDLYGEFSYLEAMLFGELVRPGQVVLEVGANIGAHTVHLARLVGPRGAVIAFEPQRIVFQLLCANAALNALTNIRARQAAVGRASASLLVPDIDYAADGNFGGVSLGHWDKGEPVPVVTVDSLDLPACHLIKLDCEGMEGEAIEGAAGTIKRCRPVLYVENDRQEKSAALIAQLLDLDYRLYWHLPPLFNPDNFFGLSENVFGRIVSRNMLCVHRDISQRIEGLREISAAAAGGG